MSGMEGLNARAGDPSAQAGESAAPAQGIQPRGFRLPAEIRLGRVCL